MSFITALFHEKEGNRVFIGDNNSALGVANAIAKNFKAKVKQESVINSDKIQNSAIIVGAGLGESGLILNKMSTLSGETVWGIHRRGEKWQKPENMINDLQAINWKYIPIYLFDDQYHDNLKRNGFILTEGVPHNREEKIVINALKKAENLEKTLISKENINFIVNLRGSVPGSKISRDICYKIGFIAGKKLLSLKTGLKKDSVVFFELGNEVPLKILQKGFIDAGYKGVIINNKMHFKDFGLNSLEVMEGIVNCYENSFVISSVASSSVATEFVDFVDKGKLYLVSPPYLGENKAYQKQMNYYLQKSYVHGYLDYEKEMFVEINKNICKKPLDSEIIANFLFNLKNGNLKNDY